MKQKITAQDLADLGACHSQLRKFKRIFPEGVTISLEHFREAEKKGLDVYWLIENALTMARYEEWDQERDKIWDNHFGLGPQSGDLSQTLLELDKLNVRFLRNHWKS